MVYKKLFLLGVMATGLSVELIRAEISEVEQEVNELIDAYAGKLPAGMSKEKLKQDIPNYFTQEGLKALKHCISVPDECQFPGVHNYEKEKSKVFFSGEESSAELMVLVKRFSLLEEHIKSNCDKVTLQFIDEMIEANTLEKTLSTLKKYTGTFFTQDVFDKFAQDKFAQEGEATLEDIVFYIGMLRNLFLSKNR